ncbi:YbaB/EbfC family nucleoid-associated protein [Microbacterium sp. RG1]|uniref:YbaB/EbfC family nucleoid-associated protein n=1 Tax=Microbacterium sp. RG1 TaxID=2489212 RepID=UPI0010CA54DF|nr:YbaB/EbfC family nucleoid-associated protein [Microbacterium sp. RG1]QCQ15829.1 YbaB/EbfC family DNA-binding protein [Microbacterium sp. RG1]
MSLETDSLAALEAARMRVIAQTERARTAAHDAARMADDVRDARASISSVGREVTVTARAGGAIEQVDIASEALDLDARTLSRLVTETVREAQRAAAEVALNRMAESLGADSPVVAQTRDQVRAQFGAGTELR